MNSFERSARRAMLKLALYFVIILAAFVLQTSAGGLMTVSGTSASCLPFLVAAVAFYEGPYMGGACGVIAGFLSSVATSTSEGSEVLILSLFGALCGVLAFNYMRQIITSILVCACGYLAVRGIISGVYYRMFFSVNMGMVLLEHFRALLLSIIPGIVFANLIRITYRRFSEERQ